MRHQIKIGREPIAPLALADDCGLAVDFEARERLAGIDINDKACRGDPLVLAERIGRAADRENGMLVLQTYFGDTAARYSAVQFLGIVRVKCESSLCALKVGHTHSSDGAARIDRR